MLYQIRHATPEDIPVLKTLLEAFMQETFQRPWGGSAEKLLQDGFGREFEMLVAEVDQQIVAFIAWRSTYDLHNCVKGGEVMDLFVDPAHRNRGIAIQLVTALTAQIQQQGDLYIKGQSVENPGVQKFYQRFAQCFPGADCYVSGRAFRKLAELSGLPIRDVIQNLPDRRWNLES